MIVYKWVIRKNKKYCSLMNFGIYPPKCLNIAPYEIGKIYISDLKNRLCYTRIWANSFHRPGFHFWKKPIGDGRLNQYNRCLSKNKPQEINAILKCEIKKKDIIIQDEERIVVKKFKVLEEVQR